MTRLMIRLVLSTIAAAALAAWIGDRLLPEEVTEEPRVVVAPLRWPAEPAPAAVSGPSSGGPAAVGDVESKPPAEVPDSWVHEAVADAVTHPMATRVLVGGRLAERMVAAVDAIAGGYPVRAPRAPVTCAGPFLVRPAPAGLVIAESSYRRFDLAVDLLAAVDAERAVARYREVSPTLERIYRERSWYRSSFDERLLEAIDHLLAVEVPGGSLAVRRDGRWWEFEDEALARLTGAQRQLLRLGPENAWRVQAALRRLRRAMATDPEPALLEPRRSERAAAPSDPGGDGTTRENLAATP